MRRPFVAGSSLAFSLVEVVLALGVTSFCLIALFGLLSVGLRSNQNTIEQAGASAVLAAVVSDLYATPATTPPGAATTTTQYNIAIPANPIIFPPSPVTLYFAANGLTTNATSAQSAYRVTITGKTPSSGSGAKTSTFFDVTVTWPASVSVSQAAGTEETFVSLDRN